MKLIADQILARVSSLRDHFPGQMDVNPRRGQLPDRIFARGNGQGRPLIIEGI